MSLKAFLTPVLVIGLVLALTIDASPMYYKKVSGQKYEPGKSSDDGHHSIVER